FIHTWLRFGEIMRGSLSAPRKRSAKKSPPADEVGSGAIA
ncbi:hypothetical protein, partial [Escherichia coli]